MSSTSQSHTIFHAPVVVTAPTLASASLLAERLRASGASTVTSGTDDVAVELVAASDPAMYCVVLSESSSFQRAIKRVRSLRPELPVVAVGDYSADNILRAMRSGAADLLSPDFEATELKELESRLLGHPSLCPMLRSPEVLCLSIQTKLQSSTTALEAFLNYLGIPFRGLLGISEARRLELVLNELLRNALEHGNLGISASEKERLQDSSSFDEHVRAESTRAVAEGKTVDLDLQIDGEGITLRVTDYGAGFDWRGWEGRRHEVPSALALSGRGLFLISRYFDDVTFNESGTAIFVKKRIARPVC